MSSPIQKGFGWNWRSWSYPVMTSKLILEKLNSDRKISSVRNGSWASIDSEYDILSGRF